MSLSEQYWGAAPPTLNKELHRQVSALGEAVHKRAETGDSVGFATEATAEPEVTRSPLWAMCRKFLIARKSESVLTHT